MVDTQSNLPRQRRSALPGVGHSICLKFKQLERMPIRVAELECLDPARGSGKLLRATLGDWHHIAESRIRLDDVHNHQGKMLEPEGGRIAVHGIRAALRFELLDDEALPTNRERLT